MKDLAIEHTYIIIYVIHFLKDKGRVRTKFEIINFACDDGEFASNEFKVVLLKEFYEYSSKSFADKGGQSVVLTSDIEDYIEKLKHLIKTPLPEYARKECVDLIKNLKRLMIGSNFAFSYIKLL